jgi:RNA polymerase sigma factor (sigma-70 family)
MMNGGMGIDVTRPPRRNDAELHACFAQTTGAAEGSIEHVYLEHALLLRRVAMRKFHVPEEDAETLVHDIFITYLADRSVVRTSLRAYLIAAICNASRNYWRSKRVRERFFVDSDPEEAKDYEAPGEDFFEGLALHLVIGATLARLGTRCREALRRYYLDEEDTSTIAAALNTSAANVNYLMHVCRKQARCVYNEITQVR